MDYNTTKISLLSLGILCGSLTDAESQDFTISTGEPEVDTAAERIIDELKQKVAAEAAEKALDWAGDEVLDELLRTPLSTIKKFSGKGLLFDIVTTISPAGEFSTLPTVRDDGVTTLTDQEFNRLLRESGVDAARMANEGGYDLRAPGGLAQFKSDLRRRVLENRLLNGNASGASFLVAEMINFERLSAEQIRDAEPQQDFVEGPQTQWCINSCLSTTGRDPASQAYQQCVATNCFGDASETPPEPQLSNAARYLINEHISNGCEGRGGTFSPQGITVADLDGDNRDDLILADEWIVCDGARKQSNTCGTRVCDAIVYVRRGSTLDREASFLGTGIEVGTGARPTVTFLQHDLSTFSFGWDGRQFSQR